MENINYQCLKMLSDTIKNKQIKYEKIDTLINNGEGFGLKKGNRNQKKNENIWNFLSYLKKDKKNIDKFKCQLKILKFIEKFRFSEINEKKILDKAEKIKTEEIKLKEIEDIYKLWKIIRFDDIDYQYILAGGDEYNSIRVDTYMKKEKEKLTYKLKKTILEKIKEDLKVNLGDDFIEYNYTMLKGGIYVFNKMYEYEVYIKKYIIERVTKKNEIYNEILSSEQVNKMAWNMKQDSGKIDALNKGQIDALNEGQICALKMINENNISIITGGPGTGKTTLLSCLYHYYLRKYKNVYVVSFTGTSVKRIQEGVIGFIDERSKNKENKVLDKDFVKENIKTIHSFIATMQKNPEIKADIIIIDEFSMVYESLFYKLIKNQEKNIRKMVIFGDPNQLPSIKKDYLFNNIIKLNKIPLYKLSSNMRASGNRDLLLFYSMVMEKNIDYGKLEKSEKVKFRKLDECKEIIESYGKEVKNILILSPYTKNTKEINNICRKINYENVYLEQKTFNKGDIIMAIKNFKYDELKIYNGTRYEVIDKYVTNDNEIIDVNMKNDNEEYKTEYYILKEVNTNENPIKISEKYLENFDFGFAITIHKAQGKESQINIVVLPYRNLPNFETINILYTAVTRAKGQVIVLSSKEIIDIYMKNEERVLKTIISLDQKLEDIEREYKEIKERIKKEKPERYEDGKKEYQLIEENNIQLKIEIETIKIKFKPLGEIPIEDVSLEQAEELLKYPCIIGQYEKKDIIICKGPYGLYIKYDNKNYPWKEMIDPSLDEAINIISEKNKNIISTVSGNKKKYEIRTGQYGPYILIPGKDKTSSGSKVKCVSIPKTYDINNLTEQQIEEIIKESNKKKLFAKKFPQKE